MHDPGIPITKHARTLLGLFQVADFAVSGEVVNQPFRPRARVLQLLGDELIGSPRLAVFELVKNAYDADANEVVVRLELATVGDSAIVVADDGEGTSLDVLRSVWLVPPGNDHRRRQRQDRRRSRRHHRLPLGEKGLGRFAVHKLGNRITLTTRALDCDECVVDIDWNVGSTRNESDALRNNRATR